MIGALIEGTSWTTTHRFTIGEALVVEMKGGGFCIKWGRLTIVSIEITHIWWKIDTCIVKNCKTLQLGHFSWAFIMDSTGLKSQRATRTVCETGRPTNRSNRSINRSQPSSKVRTEETRLNQTNPPTLQNIL